MLGLSLSGWHGAAIVWASNGAEAALRGVDRLLTAVTGRPPLAIFADAATMWAWLRFPAEPALDLPLRPQPLGEHPALRIPLGEPGTALTGFRASHAEALRTRQVAEIGGTAAQQVYRHSPLAPAGLLLGMHDDARVGVWVRRTLRDLAADDESAARLRDTPRTFLELNGGFTDTAARTHMHKNTVFYRVRKAEQILGRPHSDGNQLGCSLAGFCAQGSRLGSYFLAVHL
jgi:hypothetical protein